MTRDEARTLLHEYIKEENLRKHCYASEAVMRALARKLGRDEGAWGIAGLLHDLDLELVHNDMTRHGAESARIITERGLSPDIAEAVLLHNEEAAGRPRTTDFHHALAAGETVTGLIIATTLVYPDKKLASVKPSSVVKRMKEKAFAASVNRDKIRECELVGIPLPEFAELAVNAMKEISGELGL